MSPVADEADCAPASASAPLGRLSRAAGPMRARAIGHAVHCREARAAHGDQQRQAAVPDDRERQQAADRQRPAPVGARRPSRSHATAIGQPRPERDRQRPGLDRRAGVATPAPATIRATRSSGANASDRRTTPAVAAERDRQRSPLAPDREPQQADPGRDLGQEHERPRPGHRNPATSAAAMSSVMLPPRISGRTRSSAGAEQHGPTSRGRTDQDQRPRPRTPATAAARRGAISLQERRRVEVRVVGTDPRRRVRDLGRRPSSTAARRGRPGRRPVVRLGERRRPTRS